jgi:hypothetical protein
MRRCDPCDNAAEPLRDDAFAVKGASVAINDRAVAVISLIECDAVVALAQQLAELPLSILDRMPPQIVPSTSIRSNAQRVAA